MVELQVSSKKYNAYLKLVRRVTYIRGDSGSGKTGLLNTIDFYHRGSDESIKLYCSRKVAILSSLDSLEVFNGYKGSVIFLDDLLVSELSSFGKGLLKSLVDNDIYIVIINRVDVKGSFLDLGDKSKKFKIDFSVRSILISYKDGINHYFVPIDEVMYDDLWSNGDYFKGRYDCVVVEDTYGSRDLAKVFGIDIIPAYGKGNIITKVNEAIGKGYKNIFVFVDMASFGSDFHNFRMNFKDLEDINVVVDFDYECFEYLLLISNMLKDDFAFDENEANMYTSWEVYFENKILELTNGRLYRYIHGKEVPRCYLEDCPTGKCNEYLIKKCKKYCPEDKILHLFKGTIFEYMLNMRK